jgi:hypothetical protein
MAQQNFDRDDYMEHDPGRGDFDPRGYTRQGPMRIDKTRQDRQPVSQRQRVKDAQRRVAKMQKEN